MIFSVLALAGIGGATGYMNGQIQSSVEKEVGHQMTVVRQEIIKETASSVEFHIGAVRKSLTENESFDDLIEFARQLNEDDAGFTNDLRDDILETIREIAPVERLTSRSIFRGAIHNIVAKFTAAGLQAEIDELDDLIGPVLEDSSSTARNLADHYGELIIGSPYPVDALNEPVERLGRYLEASKRHGYPEKPLMWGIFIEFKQNDLESSPTLDKLVESISDLNEVDHQEFFRFIDIYSAWENWQIRESPEGRELGRLVGRLKEVYPQDFVAN